MSTRSEDSELIRKHAGLFDIAGQAVIGTTIEGEIVFWSKGAELIYGWSRKEVMGRNILEVTPATTTREEAARIMELLQRGDTWTGEFGVKARSGEQFRVNVRDVPVRSASGEFVGVIGISGPVK